LGAAGRGGNGGVESHGKLPRGEGQGKISGKAGDAHGGFIGEYEKREDVACCNQRGQFIVANQGGQNSKKDRPNTSIAKNGFFKIGRGEEKKIDEPRDGENTLKGEETKLFQIFKSRRKYKPNYMK